MKTKSVVLYALIAIALYLMFFRGSSGYRNIPGGVVTALPRQSGSERSTAFSYGKGSFSLWGDDIGDQ